MHYQFIMSVTFRVIGLFVGITGPRSGISEVGLQQVAQLVRKIVPLTAIVRKIVPLTAIVYNFCP